MSICVTYVSIKKAEKGEIKKFLSDNKLDVRGTKMTCRKLFTHWSVK